MRTSSNIRRIASGASLAGLVLGVCLVVGADRANDVIRRILGATPALAFDGTTTPSTAALSPADGSRG